MPNPTPSNRARIDKLMRDPRYWDNQHPEHVQVLATVQRAFQDAYPENAPDGGTTSSTVHVRSYTREQDGKRVAVSEYDRTQKVALHGPPLPNLGHNSAIEEISNNPFHDEIQDAVANYLRRKGGRVLKDVRVKTVAGDLGAQPDVVAVMPDGTRLVYEIKTGDNPKFTDGQEFVYPLMEQGYLVYPADNRMEQLGFPKGLALPPFCVFVVYVRNREIDGTIKPLRDVCCGAGRRFN